MKLYNNLKEVFSSAELYNLKHAIRINGVVDVWKNNKTCYCLPENKYVNVEDDRERMNYIQCCLDKYERRNPMKKLPSGNMSWQEYKNNQNQQF